MFTSIRIWFFVCMKFASFFVLRSSFFVCLSFVILTHFYFIYCLKSYFQDEWIWSAANEWDNNVLLGFNTFHLLLINFSSSSSESSLASSFTHEYQYKYESNGSFDPSFESELTRV